MRCARCCATASPRPLKQAGLAPSRVTSTFAGLPAHGEDSALLADFDGLLAGVLPRAVIGNDMVCSWAGSLGGDDGISLVAGTGSIAYGEWQGRGARSGGWGEVFGDEGSAYWLAREGLALFSRMADGRAAPGPLLGLVRGHFQLAHDLDLCAAINGDAARSRLAQFARLVSAAAADGDAQAIALLERAGEEARRARRVPSPGNWRCRRTRRCRSPTPAASSRPAPPSPMRCGWRSRARSRAPS